MSLSIETCTCTTCGGDMVHDPRDHGKQLVGEKQEVKLWYECWTCGRLLILTYTLGSKLEYRKGGVDAP